jgi:hypothetical protein
MRTIDAASETHSVTARQSPGGRRQDQNAFGGTPPH